MRQVFDTVTRSRRVNHTGSRQIQRFIVMRADTLLWETLAPDSVTTGV